MAIKAVFFDAAGTLIKPSRRVGESYSLLAEKYGVKVSPAELSDRFRVCFNASPPLAFPGASATNIIVLERNWWKDLVRRIFEPWSPFDQFEDYFVELFQYFSEADSWKLYPEVPETLSALKARGLIVDVISNFDSRLVTVLDGLGVMHWFDEVFISSRIGHAKPNRRIFEAALKKHSLNPENAVHVGDSEVNDIQGAINAGMTGILVDRNGPTDSQRASRISNLKEIFAFLDG